jgi:beta-lactamase class A
VQWLLGLINGDEADPATVAAGFAPSFLDAITIEQVIAAVAGAVGDGHAWKEGEVGAITATAGSITIVSAEGLQIEIQLDVEPDGEHRITGLRLVPVLVDAFPAGQPLTPDAFDAALRATAPTVSFGLYDVSDGGCRLVHGVDPEEARPIGSAFKLWILAALATEIEAGRAAWDETMPVTADLLSDTDGEIANTPVGTPITLRRYAELMISVSDNSATDHLLHRLGRRTVEQAMVDAGVAHPERNVPLLGTRELFLLKRGRTLPAAPYLALDPEARRAALDRLAGVTLAADIPADTDWTTPAAIDEIEWFASPLDECRTQVRLAELASHAGLAPVADILRLNPGVPFDAAWTDVRFKGGSETGVAYGSWRLTRRDGRTFVLAGGAADPTAAINSLRVISVVAGGVRLLDA